MLEISGGGKGSDEEHITYSGGKEIFDLLQCGWGEIKDEKEEKRKSVKKEKMIKCEMWEDKNMSVQ